MKIKATDIKVKWAEEMADKQGDVIEIDIETTHVKGPDENGMLEIYNSTTEQVIHLFDWEVVEIYNHIQDHRNTRRNTK